MNYILIVLFTLLSSFVYSETNIIIEPDKPDFSLPPPDIEWVGLGLSFDTLRVGKEEYIAFTLNKPIRRSRDLGGVDPRYGDERYGIFNKMSPVKQTLLAGGAFAISFYPRPGKYHFKFEIASNGRKYVEEHLIIARKYSRNDYVYQLQNHQIKPINGKYNVCIKVHFNQYLVHNHCYE